MSLDKLQLNVKGKGGGLRCGCYWPQCTTLQWFLGMLTWLLLLVFKTRGSTVTQANLAKLQSRANTSTMDEDGASGVDVSISDGQSSLSLTLPPLVPSVSPSDSLE